jgi:hypothetical protein
MKRLANLLILFVVTSVGAGLFPAAYALTPAEYAEQVLNKDLPRGLGWFEKVFLVDGLPADQVNAEILTRLYAEALPAPQPNRQAGISPKGSIERVLLLLQGAALFSEVQAASPAYLTARDRVMKILLAAKDGTDQIKFGERPEVVFAEWKELNVGNFAAFSDELETVLVETKRVLASIQVPSSTAPTTMAASSSGNEGSEASAAVDDVVRSEPPTTERSFEVERFFSYVEASELGRVAPECESASEWATDQAVRCGSDESAQCDRKYARQCKKLH